jgi:predicted RNA binding protein YcfA (HicA-like mRNA interferase family)
MATGKYVKNKELNDYIKQLVKSGWSAQYGKHLKLRSPDGKLVTCSYTPSCPFVVHKVKNDVRKALNNVTR